MKCGMIYRRVTEVTEIDQPTIPGLPNHWSQRPSFGRSGLNARLPTMGPFLKRKRSMESWEELSLSKEVRSFKRVRILSNIKRARRAAFASWEDKMSWPVKGSKPIDTVAGDDRLGAESTSTAEVDATFGNLLTESIILSGAAFFPSEEEERSEKELPTHTHDSVEDADDSRKDYYRYGSLTEAQIYERYRRRRPNESHMEKSYSREVEDYSLLEQDHANERGEERPRLV